MREITKSRRERRGRNFQRVMAQSIGAGRGSDDLTASESRSRQRAEGDDATYQGHLQLSAESAIRARIRRLHLGRRWP